MLRKMILLIALLASSSLAFAQPSESTQQYTSYYKIDEPTQLIPTEFQDQVEFVSLGQLTKISADLLQWVLNRQDWPDPSQHYNRRRDFGTWLKDHGSDCLNTRAKVLIRESEVPVTMRPNGCTVATGKWNDPYTGQIFTDATQMQIDHMVPLKNAYIDGAAQWTHQLRCVYTNFMANPWHLIAASGHENMSKSDSAPDEWIPPNKAYVCEYLRNWLSVKLIWGLIMSPSEAQAIQQEITQYNCDPSQFQLSKAELAAQRQAITDSMSACR